MDRGNALGRGRIDRLAFAKIVDLVMGHAMHFFVPLEGRGGFEIGEAALLDAADMIRILRIILDGKE